ncbi:glycosyltransferase family 4 protein [Methylosinus sporium]|uniref:Glycosyltransferase family 4 protein n=1 Tax=Methylosinus sporium TaxID=428 RepID=A0A549SUP9_METSR|nr:MULTISPECIES: glycosyltransferase family 1 protein [Methylosinus]MBU3890278.1 glycosyltransferase family 4 protein [Methylosinus sp. KRF6]TRL33360.1 glycosyltransferase family 4 protein [Methylosinus sporium]
MIIAYDAGAFQQSISGGIFNVSVGFLNAAARIAPDVEFVFVADPFFGEVRPEAMAALTFTPRIIYRGVLKPAGSFPLLTDKERVRFEIDGEAKRTTATATSDGLWHHYEGATPRQAMYLCSRQARPCDTLNFPDSRNLGVAFDKIVIEWEKGSQEYSFDDARFVKGYHDAEAAWRWTDGRGEIPLELFPRADRVRIGVHIRQKLRYRLADGRFDRRFDAVARAAAEQRRASNLNLLGRELREMGATVYFANHFIPVAIPGLALASWAHDVIPILFPNFFGKDAVENFTNVVDVFKRADHIFCNSDTTRNDVIDNAGVAAERLTTTWIGPGAIGPRPPSAVDAALSKFRLRRNYILNVGTLEPRKNHLRLVQAYDEFRRSVDDAPMLVIVGSHGWGYDELMRLIANRGLSEHVKVLSGVDNEDLSALYSGAMFVAYPSVYEGFGMPVLEALACGVPVLTSQETSMQDIAQNAAVLVDPLSVSSIADGLFSLTTDPALRARLAANAPKAASRFDWDRVAGTVLDVLKGVSR